MDFMKNVIYEYLVRGKTNLKAVLLAALCCVLAAVLLATSFLYIAETIGLVTGPFAAVCAVLAVYFFRRVNVEYEYCCTEDKLDIDIIYGGSRRKNAVSIPATSIVTVAPETHPVIKSRSAKIKKVRDFSAATADKKFYILCNQGEQLNAYRVSPNDKMLWFIKNRMRRELITE